MTKKPKEEDDDEGREEERREDGMRRGNRMSECNTFPLLLTLIFYELIYKESTEHVSSKKK